MPRATPKQEKLNAEPERRALSRYDLPHGRLQNRRACSTTATHGNIILAAGIAQPLMLTPWGVHQGQSRQKRSQPLSPHWGLASHRASCPSDMAAMASQSPNVGVFRHAAIERGGGGGKWMDFGRRAQGRWVARARARAAADEQRGTKKRECPGTSTPASRTRGRGLGRSARP